MNKWKRIKSQEDKIVYRWFENKDIIVSIVEGYFPSELNIRVSGDKFDSFEIRGNKQIIQQKTDEQIIEVAERGINSINLEDYKR